MKSMLLISTLILFSYVHCQTYKPFTGELTYSIELIHPDTQKPKFISFTTIYTNDTLVRTDTENLALGKQRVIRHLTLDKQYVLLEYKGKKYAIQQNLGKDSSVSKYTFTPCRGYKKFSGIKAKKVLLNHPKFKETMTIYYAKELNPKYLDIIKGIEGLPIQYYIQTDDGLLRYTLREFKEKQIPNSIFYIGKEYQKISFTDFIEQVSK